uniref:Uncharacterized protein n=1 Tax=Arundo donax TaxID=35708 RepID=A0A0A9BNG2_ARUDO
MVVLVNTWFDQDPTGGYDILAIWSGYLLR